MNMQEISYDIQWQRTDQDVSSHGKEVISFLQLEQIFIEQLNEFRSSFPHFTTGGDALDLQDKIKLLDTIILNYQSLHEAVILGKSSLADAVKNLPSYLKMYISFATKIREDFNSIQDFVALCDKESNFHHLIFEPGIQISKYIEIFQKLFLSKPEENVYEDILLEIHDIHDRMRTSLSLQNNALSVLQIQRLLIDRQPKILSPGRLLLKKGCLYKVNYKRRKPKKMVFVLFNDMMLCCRILKSFDWHIRDSLKCIAVLPLRFCSVNSVTGRTAIKGSIFQVKCWSLSYLLLSKIPGDAQSWMHELQTAIRIFKEPGKENEPNFDLTRLNHQTRTPLLITNLTSCWNKC